MKNKFNPKDVSPWCRWIAQDSIGEWFEYELEPVSYNHNFWWRQDYSRWRYLYKSKPPKDYTQELYEWK